MKKSILCGMLLLSACQPFVNSRGNVVISDHVDSFVIGKTTMQEVIQKCGTPSLQSEKSVWVYVGARSEEQSFKGVSMKDCNVYQLTFDDKDVLKAIDTLNAEGDGVKLDDGNYTKLISDAEAESKIIDQSK